MGIPRWRLQRRRGLLMHAENGEGLCLVPDLGMWLDPRGSVRERCRESAASGKAAPTASAALARHHRGTGLISERARNYHGSNRTMPKPARRKTPVSLRARIRVLHGDDIAIGPGKAELLEFVRATRSIREAAQQMGMSYMRAWLLIQTMNRCFNEPLVRAARGGSSGGGAELTATGETVLALYHQMEAASLGAATPLWKQMKALLRP